MNLPNKLTVGRIILVPFFVAALLANFPLNNAVALIIFIAASLTDMFDGKIARKNGLVTDFGKFADPLADKILVILVVIYLYYFNLIPAIYFWIIVFRDLIIFTGGIFVSKKIGFVLPSNYLGKATVFSIGIFIIFVTLGFNSNDIVYKVFYIISIGLSFASVVSYGARGFKEIKKVNNETL